MNEVEQLRVRVEYLEGVINSLVLSDRVVFSRHIQMLDGRNIQLGTTGTMIGTASTQKIGFLGKTPIGQQGRPGNVTAIADLLFAFGFTTS